MVDSPPTSGIPRPIRYALGLIEPSGVRWLVARFPSRCGPIRTRDAALAQTWETEADARDWVDSIPDSVAIKDGEKTAGCRAWMDGVELVIVPVESRCLTPIPLREAR